MDEYRKTVEEVASAFVRRHKVSREDSIKMQEFFRTCDEEVFSLPPETIIRQAYTYARRKD